MKQFKGIAENIETPILGLVTRNPLSLSRFKSVLVTDEISLLSRGFAGLIAKDFGKNNSSLPKAKVTEEVTDKLEEGDCVLIDTDGTITVVWGKKAPMNPLLLTEVCDCRCLMCPQPPKAHDRTLTETSKRILNLVKIESNQTICLTGGEPTLLQEDFFDILGVINKKHPKSTVMLLTNGKSFANFEFTKRFISARPQDFLTCVSLHSDVDEIHDRIVGVKDSFYKTAMGLQNLARFRERIEIRVVVSSINAHRLESIATFIYRNFPFIKHCAFMGMEITGLARDNYGTVWIDPYEYRDELSRAIKVLSRADVNVSIYNIPLCLVEPKSRSFARQSISGWKNDYLSICDGCSVKSRCCGIFTTSGLHQSLYIFPQ
ncbi:MAG: His-Xaa-Ser system radical SAM maturase HxsC [Deltaproteobacteria bacterium]|nr:His-Xaa-Ser system radical SAM maturase HxsC [Deltaproteobacteria bacterium]